MKVEAINIEKSFGENKVLHNAQIKIIPGQINAFMGENGAGKSTLMNILVGDLEYESGSIYFDEQKVVPYKTPDKRIAFIRQELNLVGELSIYENIFLGKLGNVIIDDKQLIDKATKLYNKLGINTDVTTRVNTLSIGQQQLVEIAKGLSEECEVLVMDEPTAALTNKEIEILFKIIKSLKQKGVAIVYISHRMKEIFELSDVITVMRDGLYIDEFITKDTSEDQIIAAMVGRDSVFKKQNKNKTFGKEVLKVDNISSQEQGFKNISFSVCEGEVVSLAGLMGAKRTEVLEAIFNCQKIDKGSIKLFDEEIANTSIKNSIDKGIAFVTEDRKNEGLFLDFDIKTNIAMVNYDIVSDKGLLKQELEIKLAESFVKKLNVKCGSINQKTGALSGGNQQKIVISKWLATKPKLLILDEPTRGIDINAKREIYKLIDQLTSQQIAVLLVSSDMLENLLLADKIVTLNEGRQITVVKNNNLDEEQLMSYMIGDCNEKDK